MSKTASNHHIIQKSLFIRKQQAQLGAFLSWLSHQLCQEAIFHTVWEPPRLLPLCCTVFAADIW